MKTITKTKMVSYTAYVTTDGREFENYSLAQDHENKLSGKAKECTTCKGTGEINVRYEDYYTLKQGEHFASEPTSVRKADKCNTCSGNGFLELKWV